MRLPLLAAVLLLAAATPATLSAQATETRTDDPKVDSTTPPAMPGICVDRNRDRKCDRPAANGERRLREAGEIATPIAKSRISRSKGGTRGKPRNTTGPRVP